MIIFATPKFTQKKDASATLLNSQFHNLCYPLLKIKE